MLHILFYNNSRWTTEYEIGSAIELSNTCEASARFFKVYEQTTHTAAQLSVVLHAQFVYKTTHKPANISEQYYKIKPVDDDDVSGWSSGSLRDEHANELFMLPRCCCCSCFCNASRWFLWEGWKLTAKGDIFVIMLTEKQEI